MMSVLCAPALCTQLCQSKPQWNTPRAAHKEQPGLGNSDILPPDFEKCGVPLLSLQPCDIIRSPESAFPSCTLQLPGEGEVLTTHSFACWQTWIYLCDFPKTPELLTLLQTQKAEQYPGLTDRCSSRLKVKKIKLHHNLTCKKIPHSLRNSTQWNHINAAFPGSWLWKTKISWAPLSFETHSYQCTQLPSSCLGLSCLNHLGLI